MITSGAFDYDESLMAAEYYPPEEEKPVINLDDGTEVDTGTGEVNEPEPEPEPVPEKKKTETKPKQTTEKPRLF
jgi:hypothetical protein